MSSDPIAIDGGSPRPELAASELARLESELARRARRQGLLDASYTCVDTPIGALWVAATPCGLARVVLPGTAPEPAITELAAAVGPRVLEDAEPFEQLRRQLDEYFEGRRRTFEVALDRCLIRGFARAVLAETAGIPYGQTRSYGEIAALAGSPRAHRAAGSALGSNPLPIVVPCHRVLRAGGALGGYGGGLELKRRLLELEGALPARPPVARS
jgi:methylated-DNA-[protein]-cysteine S-methyltransferase